MSPAGPGYTGGATSPGGGGGGQPAAEPFAADSPYFPFSTRGSSGPATAAARHSPAKPPRSVHANNINAPSNIRSNSHAKDEQTATTLVDSQHWVVSVIIKFRIQ